ncbi:4'-phosphopantetheinyl transferase family protein [Streptomyces rishiriensis]|uniref:4'-phosphopantetheinyl transferase n=1 Tax=Streptomyces rishiriensis TaxID=68264 RepID=A0ABU0NPL1_STRRH|nr:4'-phosphopantetheinyl transferase superfamily protein [Streptomyces rishiriensis]MDQ0581090.1 4'-phosphopantetheinyl transferase [Streptomyces rishiriensis]
MTGHPVQVWWARLEDARPGLRTLLDPVEHARYESTVDPAGRGRFLVGCALSRLVLGELLGLPPAEVPLRRVCPRCGGPHGKVHLHRAPLSDGPPATPPLHDLSFSVTHSGALIGVAVCRGGEVGLDVEESHADVDVDSAARAALSDSELTALYARPATERQPAFLRTWTRKEAVLKALGVGLGVPLRELEVSAPEQPPAVLGWPGRLATRPPTSMADLYVDGTHPAAVAVAVTGAVAVPVAVTGAAEEPGEGPGEGPVSGPGEGEPGGVRVALHDGSRLLASYNR